MYLSELLAALGRRWWLVVLGALGTVGLCFGAYTLVPTEHEIHATMLVLPPDTTTQVVHNPLLALGDLPPAADVLARAMSSGEIADELVPPGSSGEYTVVRDTSTSGPVLTITATDVTAEQSAALLDSVIVRMPEVFASLQTTIDVSDPATMHVTQLARETRPTESNKSQLRAILVAAVGGAALTIFGASLLDGILRRRRAAQRSRRRQSASETAPAPAHRSADEGVEPTTVARPTAPASEGTPARVPMAPSAEVDEFVGPVTRDGRVLAMIPNGPSDGDYPEGDRPT